MMRRFTHAFVLLAIAMAVLVAGCGGGSSSGGGGSSYGSSGGGSTESETTESASSGAEEGGSGYSYSQKGSEREAEPAASAGGGAANVSLGKAGDLGMVLVNSEGFVLYDFHKDKGGKPTCYGACAEAWPPVLTEEAPMPDNGASASMLGTVSRKDGTTQVTYAGHPLYGFVGDKKAGEANGNDVSAFGAEWYALKGDGEEPKD